MNSSAALGSGGEVWLARNVLGAYRAVEVVYHFSFRDERVYEREFDGIQRSRVSKYATGQQNPTVAPDDSRLTDLNVAVSPWRVGGVGSLQLPTVLEYCSGNRRELAARPKQEQELTSNRASFRTRGYCFPCGKWVLFSRSCSPDSSLSTLGSVAASSLALRFPAQAPKNLIRARLLADGTIEHLLPPEIHGDPLRADGCLAFQLFGWEPLDQLRTAGFSSASAILCWSRKFGYLGGHLAMILAEK